MKRFSGKTAIVTGAGAGIGYALCRAFAHEGAIVALNDIKSELAIQAAQTINAEVGATLVHPYAFDVADVASLRRMVDQFVSKYGRLDIAVANAGLTNYGSFLHYTVEAFDRLTSVNLRGSYFTAQAAANVMIERQMAGRILLMSSVTGIQAYANLGTYGITKAGIRMMARSLALELGQYGITVNAIVPGATLTERTLIDDPQYEENWATVIPTGRVGHVKDIVATALFLCSPEASQLTGQALTVDGGWTLQSPIPEEHPAEPEYSSQLK